MDNSPRSPSAPRTGALPHRLPCEERFCEGVPWSCLIPTLHASLQVRAAIGVRAPVELLSTAGREHHGTFMGTSRFGAGNARTAVLPGGFSAGAAFSPTAGRAHQRQYTRLFSLLVRQECGLSR